MAANWTIRLTQSRNSGEFLGYNLESPSAGPEVDGSTSQEVRFRGWLLTKSGPGRIILSHSGVVLVEAVASLPRPDVARARIANHDDHPGVENCGFDIVVPHRPGPYCLEIQSSQLLNPQIASMSFHLLDQQEGPYALIGKFQQLFLGGDSNDSIGQFIEDRTLPDHSVKAWTANFKDMIRWEADLGLRSAFLVAPAKEEIIPEAFPMPRAARTVMDDFRSRFAAKAIIPIHALRAQKQFTYCETDTHWTDYGATIAARSVLKYWNMDEAALAALPQDFRVFQRQGDLGVKLEPRRASYELTYSQCYDRFLVFDNRVQNHGCLRLWRNSEAVIKGSCLIFGDSFGTNLAQSLTTVFREVAYAYRPAGFDPKLVSLLSPDHIILQITQRFLHGVPQRDSSIFYTAATKIAGLPDIERETVVEGLRHSAQGPLAAIAEAHLTLL